jgi:molybdopterin converting factor subunit 1
MKIKIVFFASLREYVGAKAIELEVPADTTVAGLKELLVETYPRMLPAKDSIMTAINREYAASDQGIPFGAEIALFPPVSGG